MNAENQNTKSETNRNSFTRVCLDSCQKLLAQIEAAKDAVLAEFNETRQAHEHLLQLALTEAEALAWEAGYPHLLFPALAQEKARAVAAWIDRQQLIHRKEQGLALAA